MFRYKELEEENKKKMFLKPLMINGIKVKLLEFEITIMLSMVEYTKKT